MALFDIFRSKKEPDPWADAFVATARFYGRDGEAPMGVLVLTEGTAIVLPKEPHRLHSPSGEPVARWSLALVSITEHSVMGYVDYYAAMKALRPYITAEKDGSVLIRPMTHEELTELLK